MVLCCDERCLHCQAELPKGVDVVIDDDPYYAESYFCSEDCLAKQREFDISEGNLIED